jgi:hypothetical protein
MRPDVPEEKGEELFFLIAKVETLFVPEELHELPGRREPSRSISVRGSTAQPHCLHESIMMVARERDQGGVALHSTTLATASSRPYSGELHSWSTRRRPRPPPSHQSKRNKAARPIGGRQLADYDVNGIRADVAQRAVTRVPPMSPSVGNATETSFRCASTRPRTPFRAAGAVKVDSDRVTVK